MVHPFLINYAFLGLTIMATLGLFQSVKREIDARAKRERRKTEEMVERLRAAAPPPVAETEDAPAPLAPPRPGFNLNKRVHAVRMARRGEDISHIAAALGVPRREVELLLRVHAMSSQRLAGNPVAGAGK